MCDAELGKFAREGEVPSGNRADTFHRACSCVICFIICPCMHQCRNFVHCLQGVKTQLLAGELHPRFGLHTVIPTGLPQDHGSPLELVLKANQLVCTWIKVNLFLFRPGRRIMGLDNTVDF